MTTFVATKDGRFSDKETFKPVVNAVKDGDLEDPTTWDAPIPSFTEVVLEANGRKIRLPDVTPAFVGLTNKNGGFFYFDPESKDCTLNAHCLQPTYSPLVVARLKPESVVQELFRPASVVAV